MGIAAVKYADLHNNRFVSPFPMTRAHTRRTAAVARQRFGDDSDYPSLFLFSPRQS